MSGAPAPMSPSRLAAGVSRSPAARWLEHLSAGDARSTASSSDRVRPPDRFHPPHGERPDAGASALGEELDAVAGGAREYLVGDHALAPVGKDLDALPKPVRGRLPLLIGGDAGPRSANIAARWADEYNSTPAVPDECRRRRARLHAACAAAGRDPASLRFSVLMWVLTGRDRNELLDRACAVAELRGHPNREPDDMLDELTPPADA